MWVDNELKSYINKILDTSKFPIFMLWLLSDSKYGLLSISGTFQFGSLTKVNNIINLYKDWILTGTKPDQQEWLKARDFGSQVQDQLSYAAYHAAHANMLSVDATESILTVMLVINRTLKNNPELEQIQKLKDLLNQLSEEGLFTYEEYEKDNARDNTLDIQSKIIDHFKSCDKTAYKTIPFDIESMKTHLPINPDIVIVDYIDLMYPGNPCGEIFANPCKEIPIDGNIDGDLFTEFDYENE